MTPRTNTTGTLSLRRIARGTRLNLVPKASFAAPSARSSASASMSTLGAYIFSLLRD